MTILPCVNPKKGYLHGAQKLVNGEQCKAPISSQNIRSKAQESYWTEHRHLYDNGTLRPLLDWKAKTCPRRGVQGAGKPWRTRNLLTWTSTFMRTAHYVTQRNEYLNGTQKPVNGEQCEAPVCRHIIRTEEQESGLTENKQKSITSPLREENLSGKITCLRRRV